MTEIHDRLSRLFSSAPDVGKLFDDDSDCHATPEKIILDSHSVYPVVWMVVLLAVIGVLLS